MGSPAQLSLDYRPPPTHSNPMIGSSYFDGMMCGQIRKAEEYLAGLVEERRKIEAFKRELPLCMQLINEAIEAYQDRLAVPWPQFQPLPHNDEDCSEQDSHDYHVSDKTHPLEEFIPPARNTQDFLGAKDREIRKTNNETKVESIDWMTASKALVVCPNITEPESSTVLHFQQEVEIVAKPFFHSKHRSGGAFSPFQRDRQVPRPTPTSSFPDLTLSSGEQTAEVASKCKALTVVASVVKTQSAKEDGEDDQECKDLVVSTKGSGSASSGGSSGSQAQQRKPRRCWSPELHRRFINALQQLGGSQVATPKQIRELMKVDGLTNDEVKSHLQKYRLHTKKPGSVSGQAGAAVPTAQMVVLGGVWVPPDFAATNAQHSTSALFSGRQNSHLCQPPLSQDLYSSSSHINASPNPLHASSSAFYNQQQAVVAQPHSQPRRTAASINVKARYGNRSEEGNLESSKWKGHIHEDYRLQKESQGRRHREASSDAEDSSDDSRSSQRS